MGPPLAGRERLEGAEGLPRSVAPAAAAAGVSYDGVIIATEVRITVTQGRGGRWHGRGEDPPVSVTAASMEGCLTRARAALEAALPRRRGAAPTVIVADVRPALVGVAEAAEILGWDKRRVITYVDRGGFPSPIASLAGGRVWARDDITAFARAFRARQRARPRPRRRPAGFG